MVTQLQYPPPNRNSTSAAEVESLHHQSPPAPAGYPLPEVRAGPARTVGINPASATTVTATPTATPPLLRTQLLERLEQLGLILVE